RRRGASSRRLQAGALEPRGARKREQMVRRTGPIDGGCGRRAAGRAATRHGPRDKGCRDRIRDTRGHWTRGVATGAARAVATGGSRRGGSARGETDAALHDRSCTTSHAPSSEAHGSTPVAHAPGYAGDHSEGSQGPFDRQRPRAKFWAITCTSTEL